MNAYGCYASMLVKSKLESQSVMLVESPYHEQSRKKED